MYAFFNNGLSGGAVEDDYVAKSGEVLFGQYPTADELSAEFPQYASLKQGGDLIGQARKALTDTDHIFYQVQEAILIGSTTATSPDVVAFLEWRRDVRLIVRKDSNASTSLPTQPPKPAGI